MATYTQRNGSCRVQVRMRGQTPNATFDTRPEAEAWAKDIERRIKAGEVIREDEFGENPSIASLIEKYMREESPKKGSVKYERSAGNRFVRSSMFQKRVSNFTPADLRVWRDARLTGDPSKGVRGITGDSVRRELGFLSAVFKKAIKEWGVPLKQNPCSLIEWPPKGAPRTRRVTEDDIERLSKQLDDYDGTTTPKNSKQWTMWGFLFAIETCMRRGEFCGVPWADVHVSARYIHLRTTKNKTAREVPLSKRAVQLLKLIPVGEPHERMFPYTSDYYTKIFLEAKKNAGIIDLRGHDSRREGATRVAKKLKKTLGDSDVALLKLSAITGHKDLQMLKIYFALSGSEMAEALDALDD
ncbi:tyrosine-type recombinase/integrase [Burkholderia ubonensis]|uniref:tyrosine-type recombinase/integrase n=1 Tax=Burkholderia ubonensis TaxID=101571 RepID=UPI0009B3FA8A|nr:site-specific integrase [Burkholderia ubonensis]